MKKIGVLVVWLLCIIMFSPKASALQDGIYEVLGGDAKTLKYGGIALTIAMEDLPGTYHWGCNTPNLSCNNYGVEHSNDWGGGEDNEENQLDSGNDRIERQGPCQTGWHVPSVKEINQLLIAWCNLDEDCNPNLSIIKNNIYDFINGFNWQYPQIITKFQTEFSFLDFYWTSSPQDDYDSWYITMDAGYYDKYRLTFDKDMGRDYDLYIRCFKNQYVDPNTLNISFFNENTELWSGEILSGSTISSDIISEYNLTGLSKTGYTFSGRIISGTNDIFDVENDPVITGLILNAEWTTNQYTITFDTDGGNDIAPITGDYGTGITKPTDPIKNGYTFDGRNPAIPDTMPAENLTIKAKWKKKSSGGSSGGGGMRKDNCPNGDLSPSYYDGTCEGDNTQDSSDKSSEGQTGSEEILSPSDSSFTKEQKDAYTFAFKNGITTMNTIDKANMDGYIKRGHLAKMITNYVVNVLGKEIPSDIPASCLSFNDEATVRESKEIKDYAIKSCALGLMGIKMKNNEFLPNDYVTRAEFGTVLSRILWGDKYNLVHTQEKPRYTDHLNALKEEGIMTKIDNPQMQEKRGYVMIMLMRSAK